MNTFKIMLNLFSDFKIGDLNKFRISASHRGLYRAFNWESSIRNLPQVDSWLFRQLIEFLE